MRSRLLKGVTWEFVEWGMIQRHLQVSAETWESHLFSAPAEILPVEGRDAGTPRSDGEGADSPPSLCPPAGCYRGLEDKMAKPEMKGVFLHYSLPYSLRQVSQRNPELPILLV